MIFYREGYKYQLAQEYSLQTPIKGTHIEDEYFLLLDDGLLTIRKGYAWDGASGPTIDTKSSMRASLVHDVFCQVMRDKRLAFIWQNHVNRLFYTHCVEDGMWKWRAAMWHLAVEFADAGNPKQGPDRNLLTAP